MAKKINIIANLIDKQFKKQMQDLQNGKYKVNVNVNGSGMKNANAHMNQLGNSTRNVNTVFGKLKNTISETFSTNRLTMFGFLTVLKEIDTAGKKAKETIKEVDKAITDLSIAMNGTREEAAEYVKILNKQAIELKTTTKTVTDASDAWLRQGKSIKETETLIKDSFVLSKVGKIESADATDYLTSALNGYKLEAEDAITVIDKLTAVDAESASEAGGLALSMSRTASAADMAGLSMDKLIGYITTVKEVTRDSDQAVGNMMKTMLSRMNQVKAGKFIDEETGEALNDMEKVLNKVGIAMRDANGQFISSELVLDELGKKFNEFDSVTQRAIATQLGGTYQYEKVIALLSNYSKALEYAEVSANSAGSALKKFESYLGSLEASQAQLQASFESLIMNSDFDEVYSGIIEATTALIEFINKTNALKGVFTGFALTGGIKAFLSIKTGVTEAYIALNQFHQALNLVKQPKISTNDFTRLLMLSKNLSASQTKLILSSKNLTLTQKKQILINQGLSASEAKLKLQNMGLATSYTGLKAATVSVTNACKGLFSTLLANPIFLITTAVSTATMAWQSYKQSIEETRQANMDAATSAKEEADSLNELYIQYSKLRGITDKTSQQEEDFKQVIQDITEALGSKAEALEGLTAGTDRYTESLEKATKAELESQYATAKIGAKAAEEALKEQAYSSWSGSKVTINKNERMTGIEEHVAALKEVEPILKQFEDISSNGIQWEPINWDKTQDMNALVEYYYALIEAREKLVTSDNADFLMTSDIYEDINTTINNLKDSIEDYTEQQYEALKLNYEWQVGIPTTKEELDAMEQSILNASGAGKEFQEVLKGFLTKDFTNLSSESNADDFRQAIIDKLVPSRTDLSAGFESALNDAMEGVDADIVTNWVASLKDEELKFANSDEFINALEKQKEGLNGAILSADNYTAALQEVKDAQNQIDTDVTGIPSTITSSIAQIATQLEPQFSKLKDAYQSIFTVEDGKQIFSLDDVDTSMLEDLRKSFAEIEEEIGVTFDASQLENFFDVLTNGNSTAEEVQDAFNGLATSYLFSTDILNNLNDTTVDAIAKQLESLGVTNATALATEVLATKQEYLAQTGQDLSDATAENINALIDEKAEITEEGIVLDDTTQKIIAYWMQKQAANGQLSTIGDIQQLGALCDALGISTKALRNYIYFKKLASMTDVYDDNTIAIFAENAEKQMEQAQKDIQSIYAGFGGTNLDYSPIDSKKASKSAKDTTESIVWIERAIENLESEIEKLDKIANSAYTSAGEKNQALADQISKVNEEIQLQQQAYEAYMAKAESVGLSDEYKSLVQNGAITIEDITDEDLKKAIDNYTKWYDKAQDTQDKINDLYEKSNDLHVAAYELHVTELDKIRDNNSITERKYLDYMWALWKKYYESQEDLAQQAHETKMKLLDLEKSYLESVASAASSILGEQIDNLKTSQEAEIKTLEAKKKPLEEQLALLEDQKEEVDLIKELEDAIFNRRRAENQRTKLTYVEGADGKGQMVYREDNKAIREAQDEENNARFNITKHNLQDQIDYYDDLIDKTNERYDLEISNIEKLQDEWQKALDLEQQALDRVNFTSMFGEGSISKLLSGDLSMVNQWKQSYLDTLSEIDTTSTGTIGEITKQFADLAGIDLSSTSAQTQDVASQFNTLGESVGNVTASIGSPSNGEDNKENGNTQTENKEEESSDTLVGAIQTSYDVASEAIPAQVEMMNSYAESIHNVTNEVNELISSIERLNSMSINAPSLGGNAYASGTKKAEKGLALVGEEKPEAIITNDDKVVLAEKPSLVNMEGGETVINGDETEKLLAAKGIRPLREEDDPILYRISHMNQDEVRAKLGIGTYTPAKSFTFDTEKSIANSNVVNNNSKPSYSMNGDVHIHCPGVTKDEVAKQIGDEMTKTFFGMENKARQRVNITR